MIQLNLLPDIKLQFIQARRRKRAVMVVSILVTISSVFVLVSSFMVANVYQKITINNLNKAIDADKKTIQDTPDIDKILTIQQQLGSLPDLHNQKPITSRIFTYLSQMTPTDVTISRMSIDYQQKLIEITGDSKKVEAINKFVDTIKFTDFVTTETPANTKAYSNVVLANYSRNDDGASYMIKFNFDEKLFATTSDGIRLVVPQTITTRSELERPAALFNSTTPATGGN